MDKKIMVILILAVVVAMVGAVYLFSSTARFERINCFDYYQFGKTFFKDTIAEKKQYSANGNATFFYTITTPFDMPLTDVKVRVQITYRSQSDNVLSGEDLIDEFFILDGISLKTNDSYSGEFDWKIPDNAMGGLYTANFYIISNDQFNLAGLSFASMIPGATAHFNVESSSKSKMGFDRNNTYINDEKYEFRSTLKTFSVGEEVNVKTYLASENTTIVAYNVYNFDDLDPKDELSEYRKIETVSPSGPSTPLTLSLKNLKEGTYMIKIVANDGNKKSILKLRVPVVGKSGRFVFLGLAEFPVVSGKNSLIFCFTNIAASAPSEDEYFDGKIKIEVLDRNDSVLAERTEDMHISGAVMGYILKFNLPKSETFIKLRGTILGNNDVHDKIDISYDYSTFWNIQRRFNIIVTSQQVKAGHGLAFKVTYMDEMEDLLKGKIFYYVSDSNNNIVATSQEKTINGISDESIMLPSGLTPGIYKLTVIEKIYEKSESKEFTVVK